MKYNKYWFKFMQKKAEILHKGLGIDKEDYFAPEDEISIYFTSPEIAKKAWEHMKALLKTFYPDETVGLISEVCFFCLTAKCCTKCPYGKYHGICSVNLVEISDWDKIFDLLHKKHFTNKMTTSMYLKIIEQIEKEN